jgi:tRNA uridine 5-carboxymethylaminomethyl modification enzyme
MFTSRAEYRLTLRADNADQRLTDLGISLGCVGIERARKHREKMNKLNAAMALVQSLSITPNEADKHGLALNRDGRARTAFELLSYPNIDLSKLEPIWPQLTSLSPKIAEQVEINAKYAVYLDRQSADVAAFQRDEAIVLPDDIDYADVTGLSNEARFKLNTARPRTIGQAGRIEGITPAALMLLASHLRRASRRASA